MPKLTHAARPAVAGPDPATTNTATASDTGTPGPAPHRRPLTRFTKIGLSVVLLLSLAEAAGLTSYYLLVSSRYVSTDNAQVDGTVMNITAPASGVLTRWEVSQGSTVQPKEVLGRIRLGGTAGPQVQIKSPGRGQVARTTTTEGRWVTQGTPLASAYDPGDIYVTARIPEQEIRDVRLGAAVDISVDAFPEAALTGVVTEIQTSTAGKFSIYPNPKDNPANPRSTDQYIPVRIAFTNTGDLEVLPGMNVTARVHRTTPAT
jgi:multidrug resistance efflux pump